MFIYILLIFCAYLVGSIPSGYWFSKYLFNIDIQKNGSGNIGATNVARVLGSKKFFFLIFFIDFAKAYLFMFLSKSLLIYLNHEIYYSLLYIAIALLIGNAFSLFLNFSGGKGVSTSFGILASVSPWFIVMGFLLLWISFLLVFRRSDISSLSSFCLITLIVLSFKLLSFHFYPPLFFYIILTVFVFLLHRENLKNLLIKRPV